MSTYSFAEEWPGRGARGRKGGGPRRHEEGGGPRHGHHHEGHRHHGPREGRQGGPEWFEDFGGLAEALRGWAMARGKGHHGRPTPEEIEDLIALRRMRGGPFAGPGQFGRGPRGRGRGRGRGRARRGDVRLALLRLLDEEPRNGYQLMQTIEERSGGQWRPSPGSVYPTLAQLEDEGLVHSVENNGGRQYEITDAGREHLKTRADEPAPWEPSDEESENAMYEIGPLVIGIGKAAWQVASAGDEEQRARAAQVLAETRRTLYGILAEDPAQATPEDADTDDGDEPDADRSEG